MQKHDTMANVSQQPQIQKILKRKVFMMKRKSTFAVALIMVVVLAIASINVLASDYSVPANVSSITSCLIPHIDTQTCESPAQDDVFNYYPFPVALTYLFANSAHVPNSDEYSGWRFMPYSSHAVLVDLDGNGTQGVIASMWVQRQGDWHQFKQYLLWLYNGELRKDTLEHGIFGISTKGRLVVVDSIGACNISLDTYSLLDFVDDELSFVKTITFLENWALGWMLGDFDDPDYLHILGTEYGLRTYTNGNPWQSRYRIWESWESCPTSHEEFYDMMTLYGLHDIIVNVWEMPDDTDTILLMLAY